MKPAHKITLHTGKFLALALTTGPASSGPTSEVVTLFVASGLKRVQAGGGVGHEKHHRAREVPLSEVHDWLAAKAGEGLLIEPKVCAELYFMGRRQ